MSVAGSSTPPTGPVSSPAVTATPTKHLHPSKSETAAQKSPRTGADTKTATATSGGSGSAGRSPRKGGAEMDGVSALVMPSHSAAQASLGLISVLPPDSKDSKSLAPSNTTTAQTNANKPAHQLSNAGLQRFLKAHSVDELKSQTSLAGGKIIELESTIEVRRTTTTTTTTSQRGATHSNTAFSSHTNKLLTI